MQDLCSSSISLILVWLLSFKSQVSIKLTSAPLQDCIFAQPFVLGAEGVVGVQKGVGEGEA